MAALKRGKQVSCFGLFELWRKFIFGSVRWMGKWDFFVPKNTKLQKFHKISWFVFSEILHNGRYSKETGNYFFIFQGILVMSKKPLFCGKVWNSIISTLYLLQQWLPVTRNLNLQCWQSYLSFLRNKTWDKLYLFY